MTLLRRGLVVAVFIGLVWACVEFIRRNGEPIAVDLLAVTLEGIVLWVLLATACGVGFGLAVLSMGFVMLRARLEARRYRKALRGLESEVHQLRNLPLERAAEETAETVFAATTGGSGGG